MVQNTVHGEPKLLMVVSRPCKGYVLVNCGLILIYIFCKVDLPGREVSDRVELL